MQVNCRQWCFVVNTTFTKKISCKIFHCKSNFSCRVHNYYCCHLHHQVTIQPRNCWVKSLTCISYKRRKAGRVNNSTEIIRKTALSQRKLNPFHHWHCQLNVCVYLFSCFVLSWMWGMAASLVGHWSSLMGSCSIFQGLQDHFRDPWEQAESQNCLFDRLSLPKHLDGWSPRQEMLRKGAGSSPCCRWRIRAAQRAQGKGLHYFQWRERCSQKMPQIWRSFIKIQNQHIYLQREGRKTRINWLDFERSSPYLVAKSSQIKA